MVDTQVVARPGNRTTELATQGNNYVISDYFGLFDEAVDEAQGFLVEVTNPGGTIKPHFHEVDQYQIVVGGSGIMAPKDEVVPGLIHYTDGYTPYGPIHAGEEGLAFFTLRAKGVVGSHYMPGARDKKIARTGASFECLADVSAPVGGSGSRLLAESPDGAQAFELRVAPGEALPQPDRAALDREGYYLVLSGSLALDGKELPAPTCAYHEPGDRPLAATGGSEGAVVAYVCFADQSVPRTRGRRTAGH